MLFLYEKCKMESTMGESDRWLKTKRVESLLTIYRNGSPEGVTGTKMNWALLKRFSPS